MAAILLLPTAAFFLASNAGTCPKEFSDGDAIFGAFQPQIGLPVLRLENGHSAHALVKLTHTETGSAHMYYVASGERLTVEYVTSGFYKLNFAVGGALASDCATLTSARAVLEFLEPFELTRTVTPPSSSNDFMMNVQILDGWATLYEGEGGEVIARSISLQQFNSED